MEMDHSQPIRKTKLVSSFLTLRIKKKSFKNLIKLDTYLHLTYNSNEIFFYYSAFG